MDITRVYIDESGDTNLNTEIEGVSSHFIIVAIVVKENMEQELRKAIRAVIERYFQNSEMKSANIGTMQRRIRIIADLVGIKFNYMPLIVDKRKIRRESGLGFKKSFLKYLHEKLYSELKSSYNNLEIVADETGSEAFMQEFKRYVDGRAEQTLFNMNSFEFRNSKDDELIQLADVVSGSLLHIYDENKNSEHSKSLLNMLSNKNLGTVFWPSSSYKRNNDSLFTCFDDLVFNTALDRINEYIDANETSILDVISDKLIVAKYLRFRFLDSTSNDYILARELIDNIEAVTGKRTNSHELRTRIIAPLRDEQVIIASSSMGYKLPKQLSDIQDFLENGQKMIIPMLDRVKKCKDTIKKATLGELDVVNRDETRKLSILLNALDNEQELH